MEFNFDICQILPGAITIIESKVAHNGLNIYNLEKENDISQNNWTYTLSSNTPWDLRIKKRKDDLETIIDKLGFASAQAQDLNVPITTLKKLINNNQQKIYVIHDEKEPRCVIGMLKIAVKRLYVRANEGAQQEVEPTCVLDFYIHESKQRCGYGHTLFDVMLKAEGVNPEQLAVDRPSFKCLGFLEKHYNLRHPIYQNNNFVIYPEFLLSMKVIKPPVFLYNGKITRKEGCQDFDKDKFQQTSAFGNSFSALSSVQVPVSSRDVRSRTYCSSAENCLNWSDTDTDGLHYQKKNKASAASQHSKNSNDKDLNIQQSSASYSVSDKHLNDWPKANRMNLDKKYRDWGVKDAMHSYPSSAASFTTRNLASTNRRTREDKYQTNFGVYEAMHRYTAPPSECEEWQQSYCAMAPVDNTQSSSQRKCNNLQSSWNIFGVKPSNYFMMQRKA